MAMHQDSQHRIRHILANAGYAGIVAKDLTELLEQRGVRTARGHPYKLGSVYALLGGHDRMTKEFEAQLVEAFDIDTSKDVGEQEITQEDTALVQIDPPKGIVVDIPTETKQPEYIADGNRVLKLMYMPWGEMASPDAAMATANALNETNDS